mmetsp:Transcript_7764/g.10130  ORF Transcript_7764/g.10130 Transcript_7764/m.10130 type:complete len:412 (+) Transcript_7764:208-1443(+)
MGNNTVKLLQPFPNGWKKSIYVFPIKNLDMVQQQLQTIEDAVFFVPIFDDENMDPDEQRSMEWKENAINFSDILFFWLPSDIEVGELAKVCAVFGRWANSGKVVLGIEESQATAQKFGRLEYHARKEKITVHRRLEDCIADCQNRLQGGQMRTEGQRYVPLHIWNHPSFQFWFKRMTSVGNRLDGATYQWANFQADGPSDIKQWVMQVNVWVKDEDRNKSNEIVLACNNAIEVFVYHIPEDTAGLNPLDCEVLLVDAFRPSAMTKNCRVLQLLGGQQIMFENMTEEVKNVLQTQAAIDLGNNFERRVRVHCPRQLAGTTCTQQGHLYSLKLTKEERDNLPRADLSSEAAPDSTAKIYKLRDAVEKELFDWSTLGMMHSVLHEALLHDKGEQDVSANSSGNFVKKGVRDALH